MKPSGVIQVDVDTRGRQRVSTSMGTRSFSGVDPTVGLCEATQTSLSRSTPLRP